MLYTIYMFFECKLSNEAFPGTATCKKKGG